MRVTVTCPRPAAVRVRVQDEPNANLGLSSTLSSHLVGRAQGEWSEPARRRQLRSIAGRSDETYTWSLGSALQGFLLVLSTTGTRTRRAAAASQPFARGQTSGSATCPLFPLLRCASRQTGGRECSRRCGLVPLGYLQCVSFRGARSARDQSMASTRQRVRSSARCSRRWFGLLRSDAISARPPVVGSNAASLLLLTVLCQPLHLPASVRVAATC